MVGWRPVVAIVFIAGAAHAQPAADPGVFLPYWPEDERAAYLQHETALRVIPSREQLLTWHRLLASEPHVAGSPGDRRTVDRLVRIFTALGLEVRTHEIWPLLARPVAAAVEILEPDFLSLPVTESPLPEDAFSAHPDQMFGWNAYSGSGDVTAEVVYANYGRKEDFARLRELGVDPAGKIALVRYGGNYRGFKVRFAEDAGAAGVIIYTDPADGGYAKGPTYPEGGYANSTCIERGSIVTMKHTGDPLTPFVEATKDAPRLDPAQADLPRIPVQPLGWGAVGEILHRMTGEPAPEEWRGALRSPYRLTGGSALRIRLYVEQTRQVMPTFNVTATLRGASDPDRAVYIGCHHDAWNCGAADAMCGMIALVEAARSFSTLAAQGHRPARSIVFCAWGAEEFGIIGSSEWVEGHRDALLRDAVAYINLDMASMGPDFAAGTAWSLRRLVTEAARAVPQARDPGRSVFNAWLARGEDPSFPGLPRFGDLGGGSDHIGFWCHTGVPSTSLTGGGSKGTSYHSIYDTLPWYWKVVGDDYEPALMVSRMTITVASRLADAPILPLDPVRCAGETRRALADLTRRAVALGVFMEDGLPVAPQFAALEEAAHAYGERARRVHAALLAATAAGRLDDLRRQDLNRLLMLLDRAWYDERGLQERPWFRNLQAASDEDSGYAAWVLPDLRAAVERGRPEAIPAAVKRYLEVFDRLNSGLDAIEAILP